MPNLYVISEDNILYRRFPIEPHLDSFFKEVNGRKVPSSAAFKTKQNENGLSVDIADLTTPEASVLDVKRFGLASFPAKIPLEAGFECVHDPETDNQAHALINGNTGRIAKKISKSAELIILYPQ